MDFLRKMGGLVRRLDSFVNDLTGLGDPFYDKGQTAVIRPPAIYGATELENLHRENQYAGVIVDELVEQGTRKGWLVQSEDVPENLDEKDVMADFDDDWDIPGIMEELHINARRDGGAALLVVTDDRRMPSQEFDPERPFRLLNLVLLDKDEVFAQTWTRDIYDRNFGKVETWRIQPFVNGEVEGFQTSQLVHHTRLIYVPGRKVSRRVRVQQRGFDDSLLRRAMAAIKNKTSIDQSRANIIQDFKTIALKTEASDAFSTSDEALEFYERRTEQMASSLSNLDIVVHSKDEAVEKLSTSVAGLADLDRSSVEELTTAARMPGTRMTGEAPGGFNTDGESQANTWNSQVVSWQDKRLKPSLVALYWIAFAALNGPTAGVMPERWQLEFNPLEEPTEFQTANMRKVVAETDALYIDRGVLSPQTVQDGRFGEEGWRLELPAVEEEDDLPDLPEDDEIMLALTQGSGAAVAGGTTDNVQTQALNGAQIASFADIMERVNDGRLSAQQGAAILSRAFSIPLDEALEMVSAAPPERAEPTEPPASEVV